MVEGAVVMVLVCGIIEGEVGMRGEKGRLTIAKGVVVDVVVGLIYEFVVWYHYINFHFCRRRH